MGKAYFPSHIVDIIPIRLACYDKELRLIWINSYAASIIGKPASELLGRNCCQIWQKCKQPFMRCHMVQAKESGTPQTAEIATPDGRTWLLYAFPETDADGQLLMIYEYGQDITERKRVKELEEEIQAITSHDLKSPAINAVHVAQLLARADNLTDEQHELISELESAGRSMLEIINGTLTLYRIEKGNYKPRIETVKLETIVGEARDMVAALSQSAGIPIDIELKTKSKEEFMIQSEPSLLRTAIINLLKNAVEASPTGERVIVRAIPGPPPLISIMNKGAIPAAIRSQFFNKFVTFGKKGGTGLGAWSARKMIEAQGGTITMYTTEEKGGSTSITIELPSALTSMT
ncbi:PAS/PAC sensor signal transduction histidine kinase [Solidesulfovibrio fructosivorans JJ]]|uniref:histidine kinase n=1 Tax=Solidesulfovibrio fructosivorans JJ] TaxID=596151 RepID=E1JXC6_SOLFR|nr:PAS domain-containing sensor histidine kinase [Solidesulfovibrio fructosivorans]EFL50903.1 PAS/PAC sensor signal transduction histidine kinase [Solidesulfovibrio fructosivorans JJ]]